VIDLLTSRRVSVASPGRIFDGSCAASCFEVLLAMIASSLRRLAAPAEQNRAKWLLSGCTTSEPTGANPLVCSGNPAMHAVDHLTRKKNRLLLSL
jgi:hypothetical protein